jgi:hypothetical protein
MLFSDQYQCWYRAEMREFCLRCMFLETLFLDSHEMFVFRECPQVFV